MVIEMRNVVKRYGDLVALDHFGLKVQEGQVYGLLGPNGSGKSTAINCILALLRIEKGDIEVFGRRMTPSGYAQKRDIGLVPQEVAVLEQLNVYENIDYFCGLYVPEARARKRMVEEAIAFTELDKFRRFVPKKLSGGLKRRLNIACGIAHKPKLLILDEPTVAVDPQSRNSILEGIKQLNHAGTTVLYTTHYMEEVEELCTRITIMDKGKAILTGTKEELKASVDLGERVTLRLLDAPPEDTKELTQLPFVQNASLEGDLMTLSLARGENHLAKLVNYLDEKQVRISQLNVREPSLNDVFLEVTGKELRDHA